MVLRFIHWFKYIDNVEVICVWRLNSVHEWIIDKRNEKEKKIKCTSIKANIVTFIMTHVINLFHLVKASTIVSTWIEDSFIGAQFMCQEYEVFMVNKFYQMLNAFACVKPIQNQHGKPWEYCTCFTNCVYVRYNYKWMFKCWYRSNNDTDGGLILLSNNNKENEWSSHKEQYDIIRDE